MLIKRNDYSKLLCRTVPLASLVSGGQNKLKLHNLTVNLIIHSSVKNKKNAKRNETKLREQNAFCTKTARKSCMYTADICQAIRQSVSFLTAQIVCPRCAAFFFVFFFVFFFKGFFSFQFSVLLSVLH